MKDYKFMGHIACLLCLIVSVSCGRREKFFDADYSDMDTIFYDYTDQEHVISRDSVFGKISFLALETTDRNLIGMVDQVLFGDSTIIVVDRYIANSAFMFDFNGKYIGRMSRLGNGRHEYRRLTYVSKRPDGLFAVFDDISNMIMVFDERGKHVETVHSDLYASAMEYIDNEVMAFNVFARYPDFVEPYCGASFVVKDKDMGIRYLFAKTGLDNSFSYSRYYNLYSYDNRVYCNVNFEDFIFELKPDGVKARYRIRLTDEEIEQQYSRGLQRLAASLMSSQ